MFENMKVLGINCFMNFEEVNLRFYVKDPKMECGNEALFR
jgi:hypothetical protein